MTQGHVVSLRQWRARRGRGGVSGSAAPAGAASLALACAAVFAVSAIISGWVLTPAAPGRAAVTAYLASYKTDQKFKTCGEARSRGRAYIPRHDPSYRSWLDRDSDGLACEGLFWP